ncbi:MAG: DUF402 domain-containing protein [Anaerolineales bacterium]|nr:MAG: DUF402 domain-containing protein [Anaerolineales bacterium]
MRTPIIYDVTDDHHKGWYCNITRPARIEAKHVYAEDLALDLIITSDREQIVVDEEEFAMLEISPEERQQALKTLGHFQAIAAIRDGPFNRGEHVHIDTGPSRGTAHLQTNAGTACRAPTTDLPRC